MRYHFFLHYGCFFQNLGKEAVPTFMHTTVYYQDDENDPCQVGIGLSDPLHQITKQSSVSIQKLHLFFDPDLTRS